MNEVWQDIFAELGGWTARQHNEAIAKAHKPHPRHTSRTPLAGMTEQRTICASTTSINPLQNSGTTVDKIYFAQWYCFTTASLEKYLARLRIAHHAISGQNDALALLRSCKFLRMFALFAYSISMDRAKNARKCLAHSANLQILRRLGQVVWQRSLWVCDCSAYAKSVA